jgi:hypothetical protein
MSSVIIAGNTSGTITLDAPAVSGTTTLTLPANTGNIPVVTGTGTNGQVLTSSGSGVVSTWTTISTTPTTAQVGTASAGFAVGDVGTYAFLRHNTGGTAVSAGTNYAGSSLTFSGVGPGTGAASTSVTTGTSGSATSGTWKAMGTTTPFSGSYYALTLFLRVA